jgi:tRNA (guanine-N7-)-methyltransferase
MRLRNIPNAHQRLAENERDFIANPKDFKGKWHEVFKNNNPIHIEIGMGKGQFLSELALRNPDINYIGIEKFTSVLLRGSEKMSTLEINNVRLLNIDALELNEVFDKDEVALIYLNFSDPWPKNAHAKRRLTSERFLPIYQNILDKDGEIHFKTDNRLLFEYSLESINNYGLIMKNISLDLHKSDYPDNIMTEYEERFSQFGPIYRLEAKFK